MGDSDGVFGGNGSVVWKINSGTSRKASVKMKRKGKDVPVEDGDVNDQWEVTGVTEVDADTAPNASGREFILGSKPPKPFFTITVELPTSPTERKDFLDAFAAAVGAGSGVGWLTFYLPIKREHERQVRIEWPD
jgi:hypothetical protein